MKTPLYFFSILVLSQVALARPVLDCQMKPNPCSMTGATVTLPWSSIPNANQSPYRQQMTAPFEISFGYQGATGSFEEGQTIIRDQDSQMGAYWGFLSNGEKTYFAMIAGSNATGFKLGVKGCMESPRVWSSSCRVTTEEALQQEMYQAAGISYQGAMGSAQGAMGSAQGAIESPLPTAPASHHVCIVVDNFQGSNDIPVTVDSYGNPISLVTSVKQEGVDSDVTVNFKRSTQNPNQFVGDRSGDYGDYTITVDPSTKVFQLFLGGPETYGGSRCL